MPARRKLPESPEQQPQPEHIELLIELISVFQKIPQKYCLLCKAKTRLGLEAHRIDCALLTRMVDLQSRKDQLGGSIGDQLGSALKKKIYQMRLDLAHLPSQMRVLWQGLA